MAEKRLRRNLTIAGLGLGLIAVVLVMLRPAPVPVETAKAARGAMRVTVDEDGETRAHDRFVVAAPVPGRMLRVDLDEGDKVREKEIVAQDRATSPQPATTRGSPGSGRNR